VASASLRVGEEFGGCRALVPIPRRGGGGVDGRPLRESRQRAPRRGRPGVIEILSDLWIGVEVPSPSINRVKGAADGSIFTKVAVKAPNVEAINDPREAGALAECAVKAAQAA
jgi:hypothetical protein